MKSKSVNAKEKTVKRVLTGTVLLAGSVLLAELAAAPGNDQPNENAVKAFMRGKLQAAEDILEGLVMEDFESVEQGADQLHVMSARAEWNVLKTPDYTQYSNEFRRQAKQLAASAKEHDLDSAALAYLQITLTCVNCHKHTRNAGFADLPEPFPIDAEAVFALQHLHSIAPSHDEVQQ